MTQSNGYPNLRKCTELDQGIGFERFCRKCAKDRKHKFEGSLWVCYQCLTMFDLRKPSDEKKINEDDIRSISDIWESNFSADEKKQKMKNYVDLYGREEIERVYKRWKVLHERRKKGSSDSSEKGSENESII